MHDGMSPLGQACVSLALGLGCNPIFVTVRTEAERQQLARILPEVVVVAALKALKALKAGRACASGRANSVSTHHP